MLTTFMLTVFAWIFFRAENVSHAFSYIEGIFSKSLFSKFKIEIGFDFIITICLIVFFIVIEWLGRKNKFALEKYVIFFDSKKHLLTTTVKVFIISLVLLSIILLRGSSENFIYFQF